MDLKVLEPALSICKVRALPAAVRATSLYFVAQTDEELSLVYETSLVPDDALARDDGWRAFRIQGALDFSLMGVLAKLSAALADAGIGIFVVSTFNTNYILVKAENLRAALDALQAAGYSVRAE